MTTCPSSGVTVNQKQRPTRRLGATWAWLGFLVACAAPPAHAVDTGGTTQHNLLEILPGASAVIPSLGTGWSTIAENYMGRCISGSVRKVPIFDAAGTLKVTSNLDSHKAQQHMGFALGARAHFAIASGSLKAQAAAAMTQDAYSSVWVFSANYLADAEEFDFDAQTRPTVIGSAAQGPGAWQRECGDEFVYQIQNGAQLYLVYRLDYQSESVKNQMDGSLGGNYSLLEVNTELKRLSEFLTRHAQLTIEVYQFGGDPRKITGIITGPGATLTQAEQAAKAVIHCGVDDFDACETFLTHALVYATSLEAKDAFPKQVDVAPGPLLYITMPWTRLGKEVIRTPDCYEVSEARLHLSMLFDRVHAAKKRVELLLGSAWSDAAQRDELEPWRLQLNFALGQINTGVQLCYDELTVDATTHHLFSSASVVRCQDRVRHLQKTISLPPASALRGAVERAISLKAASLGGAKGDDPAAYASLVGSSLCAGLPSGDAVCGYEVSDSARARARTFVVPKRIFSAWSALPSATQLAYARAPLSDEVRQEGGTQVPMAPRGALLDDGQHTPRLLHDQVLEYWRSYGGFGRLGAPYDNQMRTHDGAGEAAAFAGLQVFCAAKSSNCHELPEAVFAAWQGQGGNKSCLGLPKDRVPSGALVCFKGGSITYDPATGRPPLISCPAGWGRCR